MNTDNLRKRLIFALWAAPLGWWVINASFSVVPAKAAQWLGVPHLMVFPGQIVGIALTLLGMAEYAKMLSTSFRRNGFWLVHLWLLFQFASYFFPDMALPLRYDTYTLLIIVAFEAIVWGRASGRWKRASLLFSGTVFMSIAGLSLVGFYHEPFQRFFPRHFTSGMLSQLGIVTVMTAIILCDTAAYFAGSLFGKRHFTSISPKKTIEGAVAGFIAATGTTFAGWYLWADGRYSPALGLLMGMVIGVFAQAGDLLVSLMKRYFRVKDASDIIPGHGGILDRFDSLFFTAPVLGLFFTIIGKLIK